MLFHSVAVDVEIGPGGRLRPRPGAAWRPQPARGEATVHQAFASLAEASDDRIAAFASVHGFLRRQAGGHLSQPGPVSLAATTAIGQQATDDAERVADW